MLWPFIVAMAGVASVGRADPDFDESSCRLEPPQDEGARIRREQRLPRNPGTLLTLALGPYGSTGDHVRSLPDASRSTGLSWRARVETYALEPLAVFGEVRRYDTADARSGVSAQSTILDLRLGFYLNDYAMRWLPASTYRSSQYPPTCSIERRDMVLQLGVMSIFARDALHPELDRNEIAPSVGALFRVVRQAGVEFTPAIFYAPSSRRIGVRASAQVKFWGLTLGPEIMTFGAHETRVTFDFGVTFDL